MSDNLIEGSRSTEIRWYVQRPSDRDCYDVYILSYRYENGQAVQAHHLVVRPDGSSEWVEHTEGLVIEPAYRFPGNVVHVMTQAGLLINQKGFEEELQRVLRQTWEAYKKMQEESDAAV